MKRKKTSKPATQSKPVRIQLTNAADLPSPTDKQTVKDMEDVVDFLVELQREAGIGDEDMTV